MAIATHHYLKILPQYFEEVYSGVKTFEVRYNDRDFHVHDILHLCEWHNGSPTGRKVSVEVTYVLNDKRYCKEGFVVMAISLLP